MNIHTNTSNSFNSITGNNNGNIFGNKDLNITFKNGIRSIDLPDYNFINYFYEFEKDYINFAKKEFKRLKNGSVNILEEYNDKPIGMNKKLKTKLTDVHYETYFYNFKLPFLKRITKIGNERFQLYYYRIDDDNIEIIFIDLYHLLIPAADKEHKEKKANPKKTYEDYINKGADIDIKDLI